MAPIQKKKKNYGTPLTSVRSAHMIIAEEMDFLAGERGGGALVDVRDLEYIIAIAQEGSLSGAGRRLGV